MAQTLSDLVVPKKPSGIAPTLRDFGRGYNREAVAGLLGAPVDMATTLANLLMAGGGYLGHKAGLLDQPPDLIPNNRAVGSSDWIYDRLPHQPALSNSPAEQAGRLAGALMSPPAVLKAAPTTIRALFDALQEKAPSVIDKYMDAMGAKQNAIVYHGSPHKFDAFDMSKIGTGEGAQAYGHGLYFSESPYVAKSYQDSVSRLHGATTTVEGAGKSVPIPLWAADKIKTEGVDSIISEWTRRMAEENLKKSTSLQPWIHEGNAARFASQLEALKAIKAAGGETVQSPGHLYTVDLPDSAIARMLDWDKPLSQQAENVRNALEPMIAPIRAVMAKPAGKEWGELAAPMAYDPTGAELLQLLAKDKKMSAQNVLSGGVGPETSARARSLGIPGIRYLDGGSRSAGAGSSNFVVFPGEEGALRILERNGMPLRSQ